MQAAQLSNPQDIVVSPDGTSVYVSDAGTNSLIQLKRAADGGLSPGATCLGGGSGCTALTGLGQPHALGISPNGASVYLRTSLGPGNGSLLVFDRAANGTLTQKAGAAGCWTEVAQSGCQTGAGISMMAWQIAVTDTNVYVTGRDDPYTYYTYGCISPGFCGYYFGAPVSSSGSVAIFGRAPDGALSQAAGTAGCISNNGQSGVTGGYPGGPAPIRCQDGADGLDLARGVTVSPDGRSVYVGAANAIVEYARGAGGALTQIGCLRAPGTTVAGCTDAAGVGDVYRMAATGDALYASSTFQNGFAFLTRAGDGTLGQRSGTKRCLTKDGSSGACEALAPLGGLGDVAVSGDGGFVYLVNQSNGVLATLHRDAAPACQSRSMDVPYQTSVVVPLTCTDANGDALTLRITQQPTAGSLGGGGTIDPASGAVRYNPPLGYSGQDSFGYVATGRGVDSPPATITLHVGSPAPSSVDADGDGVLAGMDCNDHDPAIHPGAKEIPGNAVDENCDGVAAKLPPAAAVSSKWLVKGAKATLTRLTIARLPKGWKASMRCTGKGCPFRAKALKSAKVRAGTLNALKLLGSEHTFRAGEIVELRVTAPGRSAKVVRWTIRKGRAPKASA